MINKRFLVLLAVGLSANATWQDRITRIKDAIEAGKKKAKHAASAAQDFVTGGDVLTKAYLEAAGTSAKSEEEAIKRFVRRREQLQSTNEQSRQESGPASQQPTGEGEGVVAEGEDSLKEKLVCRNGEEVARGARSLLSSSDEGSDVGTPPSSPDIDVEAHVDIARFDSSSQAVNGQGDADDVDAAIKEAGGEGHNILTGRSSGAGQESDYTPMFGDDRAQSDAIGYDGDCDSNCAQRGDSDPKGPGLDGIDSEVYVHDKPAQAQGLLGSSPQSSALQKLDGSKAFYDSGTSAQVAGTVVGDSHAHQQSESEHADWNRGLRSQGIGSSQEDQDGKLGRHVQHAAILPGEIMAAGKPRVSKEPMMQIKTIIHDHVCHVFVPERLRGDQRAMERYIKENFGRKGVEVC